MNTDRPEPIYGIKGLVQRSPRAKHLIKRANICHNCTSYCKADVVQPSCVLHNCKVEPTEWCKYHRKETQR